MKYSKRLTSLALCSIFVGLPLTVNAICDCENLKVCANAAQLGGAGVASGTANKPGYYETLWCFNAGMQHCNWKAKEIYTDCEIKEKANGTEITWKIKDFIDEFCATRKDDKRCLSDGGPQGISGK